MNYLAFDLGGSSGKLMLGRYEDGAVALEEVCRFQNGPIRQNGSLCWDIRLITEKLYKGIEKAVQITGDRIDGIGFDSFCNDFVLLSKSGEILEPVYCYRDERTIRCGEEMYRTMSEEELYRINGNQIAPFNTLNQLHAMKMEHEGWKLEQTDRLLFMSDYFVYLLTGIMQTEYTTASVTQLYDYQQGAWSEEILRRYGIDRNLFAPVRFPGEFIGRTSKAFCEKNKTEGFPVYSVCQHDTGSAFLASRGGDTTGIISTGTWCIAGMEVSGPVITPKGFRINAANEGGFPGPHHRLLKNVMGTWIIQEILRELNSQGQDLTFHDLEKMASQCQNTPGYIDVDQREFYQPGQMLRKTREHVYALTGLEIHTTGELIFIIYKSLAFKYRLIFSQLTDMTGIALTQINMIGGGCQSRLMSRITADICRLPVISGPADATAWGNILAQMIASGAVGTVEEGRKVIRNAIEERICYPAATEIYEAEYQEFLTRTGLKTGGKTCTGQE